MDEDHDFLIRLRADPVEGAALDFEILLNDLRLVWEGFHELQIECSSVREDPLHLAESAVGTNRRDECPP